MARGEQRSNKEKKKPKQEKPKDSAVKSPFASTKATAPDKGKPKG